MSRRYRTLHFNNILHTSLFPQSSSGLALSDDNSTNNTEDIISSLMLFQDRQKIHWQGKPEYVLFIHMCVTRAVFDNCVSFRKSTCRPTISLIRNRDVKQEWFDVTWDPVQGHGA
jgi:hypothetical protein